MRHTLADVHGLVAQIAARRVVGIAGKVSHSVLHILQQTDGAGKTPNTNRQNLFSRRRQNKQSEKFLSAPKVSDNLSLLN
jgi:hypothetical protein